MCLDVYSGEVNSDSIHSIFTCFYKKTISIKIHVFEPQLYSKPKDKIERFKTHGGQNPKYNKYTDISCFIVCVARGADGVESMYFMLKLVANKIG